MSKEPWNKNKTIGDKIKARREQLNLTQVEFAKKLGVGKQRIAELENTCKRPSAEKLFEIAKILEVPMVYFLTDCKLDDLDEEILLVQFRRISDKNKKLIINIIKLLR